MNRDELTQLRDASGLFNRLLGQVEKCCTRTYPNVTCEGSQYGEDDIIAELLPEDGGVYVDIGAGEPVQCSNTWGLYQRGWRGLLVEPLFWYWPALLHQRPGDFLYDSAVRNYTGFTALRVQGTVSSVLPSWNISEQADLLVPCETAAEVLARFPAIRDACRFCNIDVEGVEGEVLQTIDWETFRPDVFCVEYRTYHPKKPGEDLSGEWKGILEAHGYKEVFRNMLNTIFRRTDLIPPEPTPEEPADEVA